MSVSCRYIWSMTMHRKTHLMHKNYAFNEQKYTFIAKKIHIQCAKNAPKTTLKTWGSRENYF